MGGEGLPGPFRISQEREGLVGSGVICAGGVQSQTGKDGGAGHWRYSPHRWDKKDLGKDTKRRPAGYAEWPQGKASGPRASLDPVSLAAECFPLWVKELVEHP